MKKLSRILILSLLLIITLSTIIILREKTNNINTYEHNEKNNSMISMMLQDEEGNYIESDDLSWPTEDYRFNAKLSKCTNGSRLKYNELENTINVETAKTDKCYAYFDNKNFIEDLSGNGNHGINRGALWQDDGLLLGDGTTFYGYVNCGLIRHNFKNNVTFVLRYSPKALGGHLMSNHDGGGLALYGSSSGLIGFNLYITELASYNMANAYNVTEIGETYTAIGTYDGHTIKVYINGEECATLEVDGNVKTSPTFIAIGGNPSGTDTITNSEAHILVKEALIFDRALTAEEIARDYANDINPTNKDDMLLWYKF